MGGERLAPTEKSSDRTVRSPRPPRPDTTPVHRQVTPDVSTGGDARSRSYLEPTYGDRRDASGRRLLPHESMDASGLFGGANQGDMLAGYYHLRRVVPD